MKLLSPFEVWEQKRDALEVLRRQGRSIIFGTLHLAACERLRWIVITALITISGHINKTRVSLHLVVSPCLLVAISGSCKRSEVGLGCRLLWDVSPCFSRSGVSSLVPSILFWSLDYGQLLGWRGHTRLRPVEHLFRGTLWVSESPY